MLQCTSSPAKWCKVQYVPLSYSADIDDFAMTYDNIMNALEI